MYAITIEFDWQTDDETYYYIEARGERYGNVIFGRKTDGKFTGYCPLTYATKEFDSLEPAKAFVINEIRKYYAEQWEIDMIESIGDPPRFPHEIRCDRCGEPADFNGKGGHCPECGENLCIRCAGTWTESAGDDEPGHSVCKRCCNKYIADDTLCDRCRKHAHVGEGGAVCPKCGDVLCQTCGWWADGSSLCIRCRREAEETANNPKTLSAEKLLELTKPNVNFAGHVKANEEQEGWTRVAHCLADDLALTLQRLENANQIIDRKN
jgi:hypothetical protein